MKFTRRSWIELKRFFLVAFLLVGITPGNFVFASDFSDSRPASPIDTRTYDLHIIKERLQPRLEAFGWSPAVRLKFEDYLTGDGLLNGVGDFGQAMNDLIAAYPSDTVVLDLNFLGGGMEAALAMYDILEERNGDSKVVAYIPRGGSCISACAFIFLYVGDRRCEKGSRLGLHSMHVGGFTLQEINFWGQMEKGFINSGSHIKSLKAVIQNAVEISRNTNHAESLIERTFLTHSGSQAPRDWVQKQIDQGVLDRVEVTYYSCEQLVAEGVAQMVN